MKKRYLLPLLAILIAQPVMADDHAGHHGSDRMRMHHIHILLNHALGMAEQGSNLAMIGQMGMSPELDPLTIQHGQSMITGAENLINKIVDSKALAELKKDHLKGKNENGLDYTDNLIDLARNYLKLLEKMPKAPDAD